DRRRAARGGGAAADAQTVHDLQGSLDGGTARAAAPLDPERHAAVPRRRMPRLCHDRISGPLLDPRDPHDECRARAAHRGGGTVAVPPEPVSTHFDLLEEAAPPRPSGPHGQPASKVLLVDDEDSLRKVMKDLLERDGYIVTEARDGVQALDQVDRVGPDIIVLDLNLPGLDGYGVLSHLRSRPATAGIP